MKPSDLSKTLRQIAAKIDASKRPDRILVSRDLKRVLASMGSIKRVSNMYMPSQLKFVGSNREYVIYEDKTSSEWPYIGFMKDDVEDDNIVKIMSFSSLEEVNEWLGGEEPNPSNTEEMSVEDADDMVGGSGLTVYRQGEWN